MKEDPRRPGICKRRYDLFSLEEVEVLTQRDAVRELVLQVKCLPEGPQELQNHEGISEEVGGEAGVDRQGAGQLLVGGKDR